MDILFLGYAVPSQEADTLHGASVAGNKMQLSILKEMFKCEDISLACVTVYPVAPYPHNDLIFKKKNICLEGALSSIRVGFLNLPIIKQITQMFSVYITARKLVNKETVILTFNAFPQVGVPAMLLRHRAHCKVCCLLPDPPVDALNDNFLKKCFNKLARITIKLCDSLIVLNKEAVRRYANPNTPYIVVEGGINKNEVEQLDSFPKEKTEHNLLYCGALTGYSGITQLISAMSLLKHDDVYLDIYGAGPLEAEIIAAARNNERIRFHGKISNMEVLKKQREAWLLVNPRCIDEPISQVTFPSKMFEYMTSGTPVLTTRLNGLSEEFLKHLFVVENNTPEKLYIMISKINSMSFEELNAIANSAKQYILNYKNWETNVNTIKRFLMSYESRF